MSGFDKIIGYDTIKEELGQICDMLKNREKYERLGAKIPKGVLIYGYPGLGKTLMARCFIKESGLKTYTVRKNRGSDDFVGAVTEAFAQAKENAPSVVFLDDMDKFANQDSDHRNAEEYVAVQSGIDDVRECDVFVLATVNETHKLPSSLTRPGRFDRKIEVRCPTAADAVKIIHYYLSDKKIADDVNMDDFVKMISYSSCAALETILNEAAISAAYADKPAVGMDDLVQSVLRMQYDSPDNYEKAPAEDIKKTAYHEAGHLVASEILRKGSVGLASVRESGMEDAGGFIHTCCDMNGTDERIIISLAGKAAVEMYYPGSYDTGSEYDISRAYDTIRKAVLYSGSAGLGNVSFNAYDCERSENMKASVELLTHAELERYMKQTVKILTENRVFLEQAAKELEEKETLLYSDIQRIRNNVSVTAQAV